MSGIVWEDPAPARSGKKKASKHDEFAKALRDHPGRWAIFRKNSSASVATRISKGIIVAFRPAGHYEAAARTEAPDSTKSTVYVRYIGEPDA